MALHHFQRVQQLPIPLEEAWAFFTDPRNLARITPPDMGFEITSEPPEAAYAGLMIGYRVRPLLGIPLEWVTEITHVAEGSMFIDEQRAGPYRLWHHEHAFREIEGGTEMHDDLWYILPFGIVGDLAHPLVRRRIEGIFDHRERVLERMFDGAGEREYTLDGRAGLAAPAAVRGRLLQALRNVNPRGA